jgi:hypothetical protein
LSRRTISVSPSLSLVRQENIIATVAPSIGSIANIIWLRRPREVARYPNGIRPT